MASNVDRYITPVEHDSIDHTGLPGVGGGVGDAFPIGAIVPFGGDVASIPAGWLACDDSAYGRTSGDPNPQPTLFGVIGTTWGIGDGSTTFNVPDMRARSPMGLNDVTLPNGVAGGLTLRALAAQPGAETHTHTENSTGAHVHTASGTTSTTAPTGIVTGFGAQLHAVLDSHTHTYSGSTSSNGAHSHTINATDSLSPKTVCTYIIKAQQVGGGVGGTTAQENGGAVVGPRSLFNFIPGTNITSIPVADNPGNASVDVTINAATASGAGVADDGTPVAGSPFSTLSFNAAFTLANGGGGTVDIELADTAILDSTATETEINAALVSYRRVLLQAGNYTIGAPITIGAGKSLQALSPRQNAQVPITTDEVRFVYTGLISGSAAIGMSNGTLLKGITFDFSGLTGSGINFAVDTDASADLQSWAVVEDCNFYSWDSASSPSSPNGVIDIKRASIIRCNFNCNGSTGDAILRWTGRPDALDHQPCVIRDCLFRNFTGKGIDLVGGGIANLTIENNQFLNVTGINIHGSGGSTKNVKIFGNYFERAGGANVIEGFASATHGTSIDNNYANYTSGSDIGYTLSAAAGQNRAAFRSNRRFSGYIGAFTVHSSWAASDNTDAT